MFKRIEPPFPHSKGASEMPLSFGDRRWHRGTAIASGCALHSGNTFRENIEGCSYRHRAIIFDPKDQS